MLLSVWAQDLIDHLTRHMDGEREALRAYGELAEGAGDQRVQTLVRMILDDEVRHHQQFAELRDSLRDEVEGRAGATRQGRLGDDEAARLVSETEELLRLERDDRQNLKALAKRLRQVEDTAWQAGLVEAMELDTRKHILLLEQVQQLVSR